MKSTQTRKIQEHSGKNIEIQNLISYQKKNLIQTKRVWVFILLHPVVEAWEKVLLAPRCQQSVAIWSDHVLLLENLLQQ